MSNVTVQKVRDANQPKPLLRETLSLLDQVRNRAFELSQTRDGSPGSEMDDWLRAEREIFQVPALELAENDSEFQLQVAVPGFEAKDVRVAALPNALIVEGEETHHHYAAKGTVRVCEFGERKLFRQIPLPEPVDVDRVSATLDNGLLQVHAAKADHNNRSKKAAA